jgi:hypothetical protein
MERASTVQEGMVAVKQALSGPLKKARSLLVGELSSHVGITGHEFKNSGLLEAINMMLTMPPSKIREHLAAEAAKSNAKNSAMLDWADPSDGSALNEREGRCVMNRLKLFAHLFLQRTEGKSPMLALIDLSHSIIAESDTVFSRDVVTTMDFGAPSFTRGRTQHNKAEEHDHYVHALRHLQRRVTIQIVYDPKKSFLEKQGEKKKKEDGLDAGQLKMTKAVTAMPALEGLAADDVGPRSEASLAQSKVHLLRHVLFRTMK